MNIDKEPWKEQYLAYQLLYKTRMTAFKKRNQDKQMNIDKYRVAVNNTEFIKINLPFHKDNFFCKNVKNQRV